MEHKIKILNLYAGIGGNRKYLNGNIEVTAFELDEQIASVYSSFYPNDKVIIADAHEYLIQNYKNFDFIWTSPPCPSHSDIRRCGVHKGQYDALYPEMSLYQEIILLMNFSLPKTRFVVENVVPYYEPLIAPTKKLHRHLYWSNFRINDFIIKNDRKHNNIKGLDELYGFSLKGTNIKDKRKVLRNMVDPDLGLHIYNCAFNILSKENSIQLQLFSG